VNRPLHVWLLFALCAALVLATFGWLTHNTLRLDDAQRRAAQEAEIEGRVRLALWRMDSALALLLAQENARPWSDYDTFHPAEQAYTRGRTAFSIGEVLIPSPLLGNPATNVLLHFQFDPDVRFTSPEIPSVSERSLAEAARIPADSVTHATARLGQLEKLMNQNGQVPNPTRVSAAMEPTLARRYGLSSTSARRSLLNRELVAEAAANQLAETEAPPVEVLTNEPAQSQNLARQDYLNNSEQRARANVVQNSQQNARYTPSIPAPAKSTTKTTAELPSKVQSFEPHPLSPRAVGQFAANWLGPELVLTRRVEFPDSWRIQGCWLDWPSLRAALLANVRDLLPAADLQPATDTANLPDGRHLVALPLRLATGPVTAALPPALSPIRLTLALAWLGVLLAAVAVALLLQGTLALSERRAAFVSAVTHELRTPLTTFQMYSEMLADGMVTDPAQQKSYLDTLRSEAGRLGHLVENVLAYARLERGRARGRIETLTLNELLQRTRERLAQRAAHAGLTLVVRVEEFAEVSVQTDASAVEQILFNLVDNAGKYAAPTASAMTLHLEALRPERKFAVLRVRDHGPGIDPSVSGRLFEPFSKSAQQAAHSAPGVGLGLALCRRLARNLGGDLKRDPTVTEGTGFLLHLPRAKPAT
jgi:signal transduction histidine kinase